MKRTIALLLCCLVAFSGMVSVCASTAETNLPQNQTIEYLENGDYIVTQLVVNSSMARTAKSYTKTSTYHASSGTAIFSVNLTGNFNYTYGSSAVAVSQSVSVPTYSTSATYVSKTSSHSGATVYGSGTVSYAGRNKTLSLSITCDKYGNVS